MPPVGIRQYGQFGSCGLGEQRLLHGHGIRGLAFDLRWLVPESGATTARPGATYLRSNLGLIGRSLPPSPRIASLDRPPENITRNRRGSQGAPRCKRERRRLASRPTSPWLPGWPPPSDQRDPTAGSNSA